MKKIISIICLAAFASAIPRPDRLQVGIPSFIPKEFKREAIPEGIFEPQAEDLNLVDAVAPNTIAINSDDISPQQALQDFIEYVKVAQHAFGAHPEEIQIATFPFYQANVEPMQISVENQLPSDNFVADKVIVVNNEIPEADKVQVVYSLPKEEGFGEESIINEVEKVKVEDIPIQEEQYDAIRVASIPIPNTENDISPDVEKVWGVKLVETPNVGDAMFIGVPAPIAPSELDSLRVNFNENPAPISVSDAKEPQPFYPNNLYSDPMLR